MSRPKLLSVIRYHLGDRFRKRLDEGEVDVIGVFFETRHNWYFGVRIRQRRRHTVYIRVKEQMGIGAITAWPSFLPFEWRKYDPLVYSEGDNRRAYVRLKANHERKHIQEVARAKANQGTAARAAQADPGRRDAADPHV